MDKHHGQIVEYIVRRKGYSISDLASQTSVNRRSIYNWFNQTQLKADIIYKIGCAVKHDFSNEFPELFCSGDFEHAGVAKEPYVNASIQEDWKSKYLTLLEQYNLMLIKKAMNKFVPVLSFFFAVTL